MTDFTSVLEAAVLLGFIAGLVPAGVLGFVAGNRWARRRPDGQRVEEALAVANDRPDPRRRCGGRLTRAERRTWRRLAAQLERAS